MLFQDDLRIGRHGRLEFAAGIGDGDAHLEGGHVVLLHAHGRDLGDFAVKGLVFENGELSANALFISLPTSQNEIIVTGTYPQFIVQAGDKLTFSTCQR